MIIIVIRPQLKQYLQHIPLSGIYLTEKYLMRIFKTRAFDRWATKIKLCNQSLQQAITEIELGQYEVNLGGSLYKKRIALGNKGKSGGARVIIAFKCENRAFFVYGFSKKQKENTTLGELEALKKLAKLYFAYTEEQIKNILELKEFIEVEQL